MKNKNIQTLMQNQIFIIRDFLKDFGNLFYNWQKSFEGFEKTPFQKWTDDYVFPMHIKNQIKEEEIVTKCNTFFISIFKSF